MKDILTELSTEVARKLAASQDDLIRACITERLGHPNWTDEEMFTRLRWEKYVHSPEKMLLLDNLPLLTIWPPESRTEYGERKSEMIWTVKFIEHK